MSLYDILACPNCRIKLDQRQDTLHCTGCGNDYPIINNVPVIFPDASVPAIEHEAEVVTRDTYNPWVNRAILQSLFDHQIVLEIGAGNMALDDPCVIRMDVKYSPHVDLVADAHALPFLPGSIDYIFSLAVFEHLHNPFQAARSIYETLKDGGFIYHECNFVFAYHGYPHHYFNASLQGMEQIFADFTHLRKGVAPYQMPSFALDMVLRTYLHSSHAGEHPHGQHIVNLIHQILDEDLIQYDIYFSEAEALNVAAGTYFAGYKAEGPTSTLLPDSVVNVWNQSETLRQRYPELNQIVLPDNLFAWAKTNGKHEHAEIDAELAGFPRFNKRGADAPWDRKIAHAFPPVDAAFGAIGFDPKLTMAANAAIALEQRPKRRREAYSTRALNRLRSIYRKALKLLP